MGSATASPEAGSVVASDITSQENVSSKGQNARPSTKHQVRHRASVACASCRDRRIRCVVPKNHASCTACQRTGAECVIKNDDERRRPISKAYMSSLSDRINMLESMLLDKGVVPPPAAHPPKTRHEASSRHKEETSQASPESSRQQDAPPASNCDVPSPPDSRNEDFASTDIDPMLGNSVESHPFSSLNKDDLSFRIFDPRQEDIVHRLLSTKGNLSFDQLSGKIRFFGPTANSHVYADTADRADCREPPEQVRRAERIIRSLNPSTHEYLIESFFKYYNSVIFVVDREAFETDRESHSPRFYSSFLHITILAMGFRVSDSERDDMRSLTVGPRESLLHREAKYMLDMELERPGGVPSVQALLILGDLECGIGRDNTGWMYSGMANRLAFDIGLHRHGDMPEQDSRIRNMTMRACTIFDRYWGLFLGRPLAIKSQDVDLLSHRFSQLSSGNAAGTSDNDLITEVYEKLIELMELAGKIVETREKSASSKASELFDLDDAESNAYLHVINLDRQLQNWYRRLPTHLSWHPANIKTAPYSFFLLHQQYHVTMILLHRPWARYGAITGDGSNSGSHSSPDSDRLGATVLTVSGLDPIMDIDEGLGLNMADSQPSAHDSRTALSRKICTQQAIRVARIFWQHRQRFDGRKIFVTGIQHAGTAAIALIAAITFHRHEVDRQTYVGYLEILSEALGDMSHVYHPASRMDELLKAVLEQLRSTMQEPFRPRSGSTSMSNAHLAAGGPTPSSLNSDYLSSAISSRREAADSEMGQSFKRRRPASNRRASEFTRPRPLLFPVQNHSRSPRSRQRLYSMNASSNFQESSEFDSMLLSMGIVETGHQLDMDFLGSSAIDMDMDAPHEDHQDPCPVHPDLAMPQSGPWSLDAMNDHPLHPDEAYDQATGAMWPPGSTDLAVEGTGSGQGASNASTSVFRNMATGDEEGDGASGQLSMGKLSGLLNSNAAGGQADDRSETGRSSPSNLRRNASKTRRDEEDGDDAKHTPRNHALDFLNLS